MHKCYNIQQHQPYCSNTHTNTLQQQTHYNTRTQTHYKNTHTTTTQTHTQIHYNIQTHTHKHYNTHTHMEAQVYRLTEKMTNEEFTHNHSPTHKSERSPESRQRHIVYIMVRQNFDTVSCHFWLKLGAFRL